MAQQSISEPSNPLLRYSQSQNAYDQENYDYIGLLSLSVIEIEEKYYAVQASSKSRNGRQIIQTLDLSDLRKPQLVGNQIDLGNNYVLSVDTIKIKGNSYAMLAISGGIIRILNISKPNNIYIVSEYKNITAQYGSHQIMTEIRGQPYAIMISGREVITIFDLRDPLKPLPISSIRIPGASKSFSTLEKDGKYYLYVAVFKNNYNLYPGKIIEVSDPSNPVLVSII